MSTNWIEFNLPYCAESPQLEGDLEFPNLDSEARELFGNTYQESIDNDAFKLAEKISSWEDKHPKILAWQSAFFKAQAELESESFEGRELNKPGVQIEVEQDGQLKRYLIGDINPNIGVCNDCVAFNSNTIVKRYRVLLTSEDLA